MHRPHLRGGRVGSVRADLVPGGLQKSGTPFWDEGGIVVAGGSILDLGIYGHPISRRGISDENSLRLYLSLEVVACNMRPEPV